MRTTAILLTLIGVAFTHGGSPRNPGGGSVRTIVIPHGGDPDSAPGAGGGPVTPNADGSKSTWQLWWTYNFEYLLAQRRLGRVVTKPTLRIDNNSQNQRWVDRIEPVLRKAMHDKNHSVRSSAYVALGKLGKAEYWELFKPNLYVRGENWWNAREAAIFAMALLGDPENRGLIKAIAGDKERKQTERSIPLTGLMMDKTEVSADLLVWYMQNKHSGFVTVPGRAPVRAEEELRRFATHLLGFVEEGDYNKPLFRAMRGTQRRGEAVQALALTALARRGDREIIENCFRLSYDNEKHRDIRRSATVALGSLLTRDDTDDLRRLGQIVRDRRRDNAQQHFAIMALGQIGGKQAIELLTRMIKDRIFGDKADRAFLYLGLGLCCSKDPKARELLRAKFRGAASPEEKSPLALALALAHDRDAVPFIAKDTDSGNLASKRELMAYGCVALGLLGDPRGKDTVRKIFATYSDPFVRRNSTLGMVLLEGDGAVPELLRVLRETGNNVNRMAIVAALSDLHRPSEKIVGALIGVYKDDSIGNAVRARAISALGNFIDPRPMPVSAMLTRNYNYLIRCWALDEIATYL